MRLPEGCRIPVADPVNPRVDTVISKRDEATRVLTGTPTVGASVENRLGCAAVPEGWEAEAYVLVSANAASIPDADVPPNLWSTEIDAGIARIEDDLAQRDR